MKGFGILLGSMVLALATAHEAKAASEKYGVVDIQKVLDTVNDGKRAKEKFKKIVDEKKREVESAQNELKKLEADYEKQKLVLSKTALEEKEKNLMNKRMEFQRMFMGTQGEMQKTEMELTANIIQRIRDIVERIGRDKGYDFVWEKNEGGLVYFKTAYDLTDQVIKDYDKTHK